MKSGILLIDKPKGLTSFSLVARLRKLTGVRKIGHAGTLDPLATGVMVMLIGREFTKQSDTFLNHNKVYEATIRLGQATDTYDAEGQVTHTSDIVPNNIDLSNFQGSIMQTPPMFSAKKIGGKKLYDLARKGIEVERKPVPVEVKTTLLSYEYPLLKIRVECSKGTYIRSIAHDLGLELGSYGHIEELRRTASGPYTIENCKQLEELKIIN
ncbi:MAG: tRNA pseudouridine(55) synthase TruB [Simkaniaceae bacterium]|nr:tRNA pseudouridine(55) synthase TruB [Simkaniaceae bacterium]